MANLSDYVALQAGIPEAPTDGFTYGRFGQTGTWVQVPSFTYAENNYAPIVHTHPYVGLTGNESIDGEKVFNDRMGIGTSTSPSYYLQVAGSVNLTAGSNFFVDGSPIETFVDAPSDGQVYGRSNGGWVLVSTEGGTISNLDTNYLTNSITITNTGGTDASIQAATGTTAGVMSSADKNKLDAAIAGADLSLSRTTTQNVINNTGGTGVTLSAATVSLAGLMSADDKSALDTVAGGAIDADTLDGISSGGFLRSDTSDTKTSGNLRFNDNVSATFGNSDDSTIYHTSSTTYWNMALAASIRFQDNGTTRFTFDDGGDFTATGDVSAYSDRRLKDNISPIVFALDKVRNLRGVTYTRKHRPDGRHIGMIAQEVEPVLPEIVKYDIQEDRYSLNYSVVVALLIEAIKELEERVNAIAD